MRDEDVGDPDAALAVLRRWEAAGGIWRVLRRGRGAAGGGPELEIVLLTCTGGEEMGRLTSSDAAVLAHVGQRGGSDE